MQHAVQAESFACRKTRAFTYFLKPLSITLFLSVNQRWCCTSHHSKIYIILKSSYTDLFSFCPIRTQVPMFSMSLNSNIFIWKSEQFKSQNKDHPLSETRDSCFTPHLLENKEAVIRGTWKGLSTLVSENTSSVWWMCYSFKIYKSQINCTGKNVH